MISVGFLGKKFDAQEKVITEHEMMVAHLREEIVQKDSCRIE